MTEKKGGILIWDFNKNESRTVSEDEAEKGVASGKYSFRQGTEIPVISPDGKKGTVPSDKAGKAFERGFKLERPEQVRETFDTAKEKAVKETAAEMPGTAFLQGAAKTATFGLSDAGIQAFTDIEPEFQTAVEEENPIASTLGEIAGALPLGTVAPAAAVARGTAAIGGRVAGSKVAQRAAEFAADGLAYGMGESISDLALGKPEEVAGNIIIGGGLGGVLGGAVGAVAPVAKAAQQAILSGAEKLVTKPTTGLAKAVAKRKAKSMGVEGAEELIESGAFREVLDPEQIAKSTRAMEEAKTGVKQFNADLNTVKNELKSAKKDIAKELRAQKAAIRDEDYQMVEAITTKMTEAEKADAGTAAKILSELQNDVDTVATNVYAEARNNLVEQASKKQAFTAPEQAVYDEFLAKVDGFIDQAKRDNTAYPAEVANRMQAVLDSKVVKSPAEAAALMLDLKEVANRSYGTLKKGTPAFGAVKVIGDFARKGLDDMGLDATKNLRFADQLYTSRSEIRKMTNSWRKKGTGDALPANKTDRIVADIIRGQEGKAGLELVMMKIDDFFKLVDPEDIKAQEALEAATRKMEDVELSIKGRKEAAEQIKAARQQVKEGRKKNQLLRAKISQELGGVQSASTVDELATLVERMAMDSQKLDKATLARKMSSVKQYLTNNQDLNTVEKYAYIAKELGDKQSEQRMKELLEFQKNAAIMDQLEGKDLSNISKLAIFGTAAAEPMTGLGALAISKAVHLANSPKAALEVIPAIERYAAKGRQTLDSFSSGFAKAMTGKAAARGVYAPISRDEYNKAAKAIEQNRDPVAFQNRLSTGLESISAAPNVQMALMTKAVQTQQYLDSKMPKNPLEGTAMFTPKWEPSEAQVNEWMRRYRVAENPSVILPKLQDGTVTPEEVETFKEVHPQLYEQTRQRMALALAEMDTPPPYNMMVTLSFVFDMPTDPTLDGSYVGFIQELIANYPKDKPQSNQSMSKLDPTTFMSDNQQVVYR